MEYTYFSIENKDCDREEENVESIVISYDQIPKVD